MPAIKFRGVDFIQFDSLLTEEERIKLDEIDTAKFDGRHDEPPCRANI